MSGRSPMLRLAEEPHHDGSPVYTSPGPYSAGGSVTVRLRVPAACRADRVRVRSTPDAEPLMIDACVDSCGSGSSTATWWVAELPLHNPVTNYRFLLEGGEVGYGWVTEAGLVHRDITDATDFRIVTDSAAPSWLVDTVGYQIFIDRFASSGTSRQRPSWAIAEAWGAPLDDDPHVSTRQWFGGDLGGIEQHLDHLERLGVNLVYLTPFFPARSAHRYDASSFDEVDPLLGGDDALASLIGSAHARGIRVIGDITLNHTGDDHEWFRQAQRDLGSPEAAFYMFGDEPDDYVAWHDVASLPKLDHRSSELAMRLHDGPRSVIAKYLDAPFGLDGWRVDCANTTGRFESIDTNAQVAAATRSTIEEHTDGAGWLVAEHCYDSGTDLSGGGWHGVMAYQWWTRPVWSWLLGDRAFSLMSQIELPRLGGADVVASMRELGAPAPWAARSASMTMLDSHDTARFRTAVGGDAGRHVVGLAALMTMPGVPTLFAGSEVGVEGDSMDSARVPFPWDESEWDGALFEATRTLASVRAASPALRSGALRWLDATADTITFVRELVDEVVLVHLCRSTTDDVAISFDALGAHAGVVAFEPLFGDAPTLGDGVVRCAGVTGASISRCRVDVG